MVVGGGDGAVWKGTVVGVSVAVLMVAAVVVVIRRLRAKADKTQLSNQYQVVSKGPPLFESQQPVLVRAQVGSQPCGLGVESAGSGGGCAVLDAEQETHQNGKLAVFNPMWRAKSADCLLNQQGEGKSDTLSLTRTRNSRSASINSLDTLPGDVETLPDTRRSFTLKRGPFVEFTVQWASSTSSISVYVVRITSLPPKYRKCSCTLTVTLTRENHVGITRVSPRLRNSTLNPECNYVFSFPVSLEHLRQSVLLFGLQIRRSKHLLNKQVADLRYSLSEAQLEPDTPRTATEPFVLKKKETTSPWASVAGGSEGGGGEGAWGQVQVVTQYKVTGTMQARIKVVVVRAHSVLISKGGGGDYRMEMVVKRGEETLVVHQTKAVPGPNPVWNTPFIFDVAQDKVKEHWIEMKLMRFGMMKKTNILGHMFLGLDTTPTGSQQWQDIIDSMDKEVTTWHPIILHD
ncbi:synaptotagmin-7-like isoform X2 [Homarus americanus]|uniref:synaptotagmin-7-like isoform X2 n=1 Tax=Homarus americanus TaxID=6706 RepID=UPI001C43B6B9|nr:synaptotagmin-7-like isoform X2 [Homarus americanus]